METLLQQLLSGTTVGSTYALVALGFSMQYRAMNLLNFAHGESFMLGAFVALGLLGVLPFWVALLATLAIMALLGAGVERLVCRPLYDTPPLNLLIATIGLSIFLRQAANIVFGPNAYPFPSFLSAEPVRFGALVLVPEHLGIVAVSLALMYGFQLLLTRTKLGKAMRATALDPQAAALMGIPVHGMYMWVFALSTALGAAAGVLFAPLVFVQFDMGLVMGIKGFTAAVVGGVGSLPGAVLGGLLLGLVEQVTGGYLSSLYKDAITLSLLILMLLIRPAGLLGKAGWGKV
ncbi:MAG: branched-chain amino acid ABC transporter permease [Chloroflexi bacterium]|nr:branched-chain amino acid ABC transporter permease [Chloroflexota bacterium]